MLQGLRHNREQTTTCIADCAGSASGTCFFPLLKAAVLSQRESQLLAPHPPAGLPVPSNHFSRHSGIGLSSCPLQQHDKNNHLLELEQQKPAARFSPATPSSLRRQLFNTPPATVFHTPHHTTGIARPLEDQNTKGRPALGLLEFSNQVRNRAHHGLFSSTITTTTTTTYYDPHFPLLPSFFQLLPTPLLTSP